MRYHFENGNIYSISYGETYRCDHPVYDRCTLYRIGEKGLAVIQQHFDGLDKTTRWGEIQEDVRDLIYLNPKFRRYFEERAAVADEQGLYPTVTVRQIMWALRMKPLKKPRWETVFDRRDI